MIIKSCSESLLYIYPYLRYSKTDIIRAMISLHIECKAGMSCRGVPRHDGSLTHQGSKGQYCSPIIDLIWLRAPKRNTSFDSCSGHIYSGAYVRTSQTHSCCTAPSWAWETVMDGEAITPTAPRTALHSTEAPGSPFFHLSPQFTLIPECSLGMDRSSSLLPRYPASLSLSLSSTATHPSLCSLLPGYPPLSLSLLLPSVLPSLSSSLSSLFSPTPLGPL